MWQHQYTDELYHYGILGMKWGRRRYQNKDGTLTPEGRRQYKLSKTDMKKFENKYDRQLEKLDNKYQNRKYKDNIITDFGKYEDEHSKIVDEYFKNRKRIEKSKKIMDKLNKSNESKAKKQAKKQAKYEKWVKDNDRRVGAYGKGMVKYSNRVNMAAIAVSGAYATSVAERVGAYACKQALAKTGGVATAKTRATGAATLAAMGLTAGYTIRAISQLHKDNKLADSYADRQADAKQVKQKKKNKRRA